MTAERFKIDAADLTLRETAELEEAMGMPLGDLLEKSQSRGIAGLVWVTRRRTHPDFTFEQALDMKMSELELVTPGEVPAASNGGTPPKSPAPGH